MAPSTPSRPPSPEPTEGPQGPPSGRARGADAVRIGISGWRYGGWRGAFYPKGLPQRRELEYAAGCFPTLEINGSFYSLQDVASWRSWRETVPAGFVFAVKGSRFISHMKRLRDCRVPLANFFASGVLELGERLGPLLWQLPPRTRYDPERLEEFLTLLPRTTGEAAALAAEHDDRVKQPVVGAPVEAPMRYALEIRHESFCVPEAVAQLRRHGVALVVAHTAGSFPAPEDVTADFVYVRLHGVEGMYAGSYPDDQLDGWARRIRAWSAGGQVEDADLIVAGPPPDSRPRDVFVYFDNDQKAHAPFDARRLIARVGTSWAPEGELGWGWKRREDREGGVPQRAKSGRSGREKAPAP